MLDKLKQFGKSAFVNTIDKLTNTRITDIYDAGLPDVKGPKPMTLNFLKDRVEITYKDFIIFGRKIIIKPDDILELQLGVEGADITGNAIKGAIPGGLLMGGVGAIAMAGLASKKRKEDSLRLIIKYKGESRPLYFQNTNKSHKLYQAFKKIFLLRTVVQSDNNIVKNIVNTSDIAKQLTDLNNLVQQGILTQEEFDTQKKKILST